MHAYTLQHSAMCDTLPHTPQQHAGPLPTCHSSLLSTLRMFKAARWQCLSVIFLNLKEAVSSLAVGVGGGGIVPKVIFPLALS